MKKIIFLFMLLFGLTVSFANDDLDKFENILQNYFYTGDNYSSYGRFGTYTPNIRYNAVVEKELKLIIRKNYEKHKSYFDKFKNPYYPYYRNRDNISDLEKLLLSVPRPRYDYELKSVLFNPDNLSDQLINSSLNIDYNSDANDGLLRAIRQKIDSFYYRYGYYPSLDELKNETIYLNRKEKKVGGYLKNIEYKVSYKKKKLNNEEKLYQELLEYTKFKDSELKEELQKDLENIKKDKLSQSQLEDLLKKYDRYRRMNYSDGFYQKVKDYIKAKYFNGTYILKYKNVYISKQQALDELAKISKLKNEKKDYKKLIKGKISNIPEIYKKLPKDAIILHIKNPKFLFKLMDDSKTAYTSSVLVNIKNILIQNIGEENYKNIEDNLKHEFIIVLSDLDLSAPSFLVILDKKDKGVLLPQDKVFAAKTVDDKIYISYSKNLLNKYLSLDEKDSLYYADDFHYVWYKKQNIKKDVFLFVGDEFLEKATSLDYFVKMRRKINDYMHLKQLQDYVKAYEKLTGKKVNSFDDLSKYIPFKKEVLKEFTVSNSIVKHNKIGTLDDVLPLEEVNYNTDKIKIADLQAYKQSILKYKQVWQANLDPLGIILTENKNSYTFDLFMTPIPDLGNADWGFFVNIFKNFAKNKIEIIDDSKYRIGSLGVILAFDADKFKKFIQDESKKRFDKRLNLNRDDSAIYYFLRTYWEINDEIFDYQSRFKKIKNAEDFLKMPQILDYIDGEFILSVGDIDGITKRHFETEDTDIMLGIKFKSNDKAEEFVALLYKKFAKKALRYRSYNSKLENTLIKPVGEKYNGALIYKISAPYIDKLYYTIVGNMWYVSLSKNTIKKVIDQYKKPSLAKQKFIKSNFHKDSILYMFMDSDNLLEQYNKMKDKKYINKFIIDKLDIDSIYATFLELRLYKYFYNSEYDKEKDFKYDMQKVKIYSKNKKVFVHIDKQAVDKFILEDKYFKKYFNIDEKYYSEKGGDIVGLLKKVDIEDIIKFNLASIIDKNLIKDILPNNLVLSFTAGNDEIQLKLKSFKQEENNNIVSKLDIENNKILFTILLFIIAGIFGLGIAVMVKKVKSEPH